MFVTEVKQIILERSAHVIFFLCEIFCFLLTYVITPVTILIPLIVGNFFFWADHCLRLSLVSWCRTGVSLYFKLLSRLWNGHEIIGRENIPETGPALLLYYHGALPVDYYYLVADTYLSRGRLIHSVTDKFLLKLPGFRSLLEGFEARPGTRESLASLLREGNLLGLSPGGTYEAQMGDSNYKVMWRARDGFARILAQVGAEVAVIPVFTQNIREAYKAFNYGFTRSFWVWLHDVWKIRGFVPVYGGFPVKLKTYVGPSISIPAAATVEEIRSLCLESLESLVKQKQEIPGSTWRALAERVL